MNKKQRRCYSGSISFYLPINGSQLAGLGIAFHAKPKVQASAKNSISEIGLVAILYLIGFRDREINA
ncbi:hypothetical protein [Mangrovibacterium lignilyticum]|uniref:hypothetical protein n=1 Tax=Mangrovibacterium lignilyticum TaxID=2668052 RepID=UPI001EE5A746|nr:hypothetical protein [Mangrovibacterium lignilyticum]